jgi:3-deoxy-D-manno-octulosonic-acid transferase
VFFLYEIFQKIVYLILVLLSKIIINKKFRRYCELRNPSLFINEVKKAKIKRDIFILNNENYPIYWFHVASAGEMEQAIPVARKLNEKMGAQFFVTYYSPSAEPFLKNFPAKIGCVGLPIDVRKYYKIIFKELSIEKMFFVRYDIWPSLFKSGLDNRIELNLISASSEKTKKGILGYFSEVWNKKYYINFSNIFAVSNDDVKYFLKYLPKSNVFLSGDAKWARAYERALHGSNKKNDKEFSYFYSYCTAQKESYLKKCIVFGSPHSEEHKIAIECSSLKEKILMIYVPHDADSKNCQNILEDFYSVGTKAVLFSELIKKIDEEMDVGNIQNSDPIYKDILLKNNDVIHNDFKIPNHIYNFKKNYKFSSDLMSYCEVIIVDKVGFLAEIYELGDIAIIGGGFDGQIHNVLEPAAHGVPVLIGNLFLRAREANELVNVGGAISFQNRNELFQFLVRWVSLIEAGADSTHPAKRLGLAKAKTLQLFKSIPDTSEIILQAFLKGKRSNS